MPDADGEISTLAAVVEMSDEIPQARAVSEIRAAEMDESLEIIEIDGRSHHLGDTDILPTVGRQNARQSCEAETGKTQTNPPVERGRLLPAEAVSPCRVILIAAVVLGILAVAAGTFVLLRLCW